MRAVVQRVERARVTVANEIAGEIGRGLLVLLGVSAADRKSDAAKLAAKPAVEIKKTEMEPGGNGDEYCRWS